MIFGMHAHRCCSPKAVHLRVVMETLGHSEIGTTMNIYSHVIPALQQDAAQRLDAVLSAR
jgi:integrase